MGHAKRRGRFGERGLDMAPLERRRLRDRARLARVVATSAFALALAAPSVALAATGATVGDGLRYIAAALALGLAALGAGIAQGKIGSAGQATLAERPEERVWILTLTVLPEIIVLLGFVLAILLANA
jgi:V/A-type H+/Na+-transporting ATPase subunit K